MVISFSVPEVRDQLMTWGLVYTFRWNKRKQVGQTWANEKRGGKKIADVSIKYFGERSLGPFSLGHYAPQSGFNNVNDWIDKIKEMPNPKKHTTGHLYEVKRLFIISVGSQKLRTEKQ